MSKSDMKFSISAMGMFIEMGDVAEFVTEEKRERSVIDMNGVVVQIPNFMWSAGFSLGHLSQNIAERTS